VSFESVLPKDFAALLAVLEQEPSSR
jgi:hypothetical protein